MRGRRRSAAGNDPVDSPRARAGTFATTTGHAQQQRWRAQACAAVDFKQDDKDRRTRVKQCRTHRCLPRTPPAEAFKCSPMGHPRTVHGTATARSWTKCARPHEEEPTPNNPNTILPLATSLTIATPRPPPATAPCSVMLLSVSLFFFQGGAGPPRRGRGRDRRQRHRDQLGRVGGHLRRARA